jgi:hypothetical protein
MHGDFQQYILFQRFALTRPVACREGVTQCSNKSSAQSMMLFYDAEMFFNMMIFFVISSIAPPHFGLSFGRNFVSVYGDTSGESVPAQSPHPGRG